MDIENYQEFVRRVKKGEILIGVEPAVARRFFTNADANVLKEKIGEALHIERLFVKTCWLLDYICLLAGIITSIFAVKWYSVIAIPVMIIAFVVLGAQASGSKQTIKGATLFVIFCLLLAYEFRDHGVFMIIWLILLPMPYFFSRLTYKLSTVFLRALVVRSKKALDFLLGNAIFLKESSGENQQVNSSKH